MTARKNQTSSPRNRQPALCSESTELHLDTRLAIQRLKQVMIERRSLKPAFYLRHPFLQTAMASLKFRVSGELLRRKSEFHLIKTSNGARLLSSYAKQTNPKGVVLLLHGWEGGIESTYVLRTGEYLMRRGYSIFRLNLRDHGETHHLNDEPFNGTMLDEVYEAMCEGAAFEHQGKYLPAYMIGFSLGGNFVLRMALAHSIRRQKIRNLRHVLAVSPAVDPAMATKRIDQDFLLRPYFLQKWSESLLKKQKLFPYLHNFDFINKVRSVMELTETGIDQFTPFDTAKEYFQGYTIAGDFFQKLTVPTTIITSADDPIITEEDFIKINPHPLLRTIITDKGGHNGFLVRGFHPAYLDLFDEIVAESTAATGFDPKPKGRKPAPKVQNVKKVKNKPGSKASANLNKQQKQLSA